jgi:hypothetical protein
MSTTVTDGLKLTALQAMLSSNGPPINLRKFSKKEQSAKDIPAEINSATTKYMIRLSLALARSGRPSLRQGSFVREPEPLTRRPAIGDPAKLGVGL